MPISQLHECSNGRARRIAGRCREPFYREVSLRQDDPVARAGLHHRDLRDALHERQERERLRVGRDEGREDARRAAEEELAVEARRRGPELGALQQGADRHAESVEAVAIEDVKRLDQVNPGNRRFGRSPAQTRPRESYSRA